MLDGAIVLGLACDVGSSCFEACNRPLKRARQVGFLARTHTNL